MASFKSRLTVSPQGCQLDVYIKWEDKKLLSKTNRAIFICVLLIMFIIFISIAFIYNSF